MRKTRSTSFTCWWTIYSAGGCVEVPNNSQRVEQLLEGEQRAAEWMRKAKEIPPSSIEDPPEHRPAMEKDASTA